MRRVLLLLLLTVALPACTKNYVVPQDTGGSPSPSPVPVTHTVEFRVLGTVPLSTVTFGSAQDGTTVIDTTLPWSASVKTSRSTLFVYLRAESSFSGRIQAQIFVDGQLFREAANNFLGSTNVADASGTVDLGQ